ncbi:MAG TPA: histidine kinase dimerization/phospho-acceptor domain-containing protein [Myxococcota bacterium]|jgi:DNA-binding NtrC family response regulator
MPRLWIVHREPRTRAALSRLAAAPHDALLGAPGDPAFAGAEPPAVVVLGLAAPFEAELEFAHRLAPRLRGAAWLLLAERAELPAARRLFDLLDAELLPYPPDASALRRRLRELARRSPSRPLALSQRAVRDTLAARFARWFRDLELPALLRALDPQLRDVPVLVRGEPGTGRGSLARYLHAFGGGADAAFAQVACSPGLSAGRLLDAIADAARSSPAAAGATVCLLGVDRLEPAAQRELLDWIELGPPPGLLRARPLRWIATAGDDPEEDALDPALRQALGGFLLRIPPLRERAESIPALVKETAARFGAARGERTRGFGDDALRALCEYPWPGNLRELESVVVQSLAASAADPLEASDLEQGGEAFAPVDAESLGAVLLAGDEPEPEAAPAPERLPAPAPFAAPAAAPPAAEPAPPQRAEDAGLGPLAAALAHELRSPLTGIRTFSELLPERWADAEFRARFAERTGEDVRRIEESLSRLSQVADFGPPADEVVDVTALLGELLEARREQVRERRLLVLQELDTQRPEARGDVEQIRFALDALLGACFALVPERGDLYLASKHHPTGLRGGPSLRVLVRFHGPQRGAPAERIPGLSPAENSLGLVLAERVIHAQQGSFTLSQTQGGETLLIVELRA